MDQKKKVAESAGSPPMPKKPGDRSRMSAKPAPNYMKPIRNHRARKEVLEVSTHSHKPCSCGTKQNSNIYQVASGQSKMRRSTMKPLKEKDEHTCSSVCKDATLQGGPDAGHGHTSIKKVCKYSRCSLNAHGREPAAKHPFLVRRLSVKARKSFRVKGVPASSSSYSSSSRRRGVWKVEKPDIDRHASCWDGSISAVSASQRNNLQRGTERGDIAEEMEDHDTNSYGSIVSFGEHIDWESEFSAAELDIIRNFLEDVGSNCVVASDKDNFYGPVTGRTEWCLDRSNLEELYEMINIFPEEGARLSTSGGKDVKWNEQTTQVREVEEEYHRFEDDTEIFLAIERAAAQMGAMNFDEIWGSSNKDPGEDPPALALCIGNKHDTSVEDPNESGLEAESIINEAEEYDIESPAEEDYPSTEFDCQLEKEYFPANVELLLEEYLSDGSEIANEDGAASNTEEDHEKPTESDGKLDARLSMKKSLIKKCLEKLKTIRQFREPDYLPTARERELKRAELRQMAGYDERSAEEWMVDYKLRRLIAELARARKRKVELLVEAFESVAPKSIKACY